MAWAPLRLAEDWPGAWVAMGATRWAARLTAASYAATPVEEVRLIGKGNPTFYPTPAGLKTLRGWAMDNLSEDLAEWVADGLPKGARVVRPYVVGYKERTTGLSEDLLGPIDAASPEEAMEWAFATSGHDDKQAFFRDLEARPAEDAPEEPEPCACGRGARGSRHSFTVACGPVSA